MLSLFRTNQFIANIFLLVYAAIIRLAAFLVPVTDMPDTGGVFSDWVYQWIDPLGQGGAFAAYIIVCFQAILINIILSRHRMASELSLLPGMFYLFLASCMSEFLYLSPVLMATTFYLLALSQMLASYKKFSAAGEIFNIGLWIGVASLFYSSLIIFLLLAVIGLRTLRAFRFKEQLILLSGFLAPYFLTFVGFFFTDQYAYFIQTQFVEGFAFFNNSIAEWNWLVYIKLGFFAFLVLFVILSFNRYMLKKNIEVQKGITVLYWGILISLFSFFFQANVGLEHLLLMVPSLGIFLSFNFLRLSRPMAEALHLLLLFGVLVLQFQPWWMVAG